MDLVGIGEITVKHSKTARSLKLAIKPFEGITLTLPPYVNKSDVVKFLENKQAWIQKSYQKIRKIESSFTIFNENEPFHTKYHQLQLKEYEGKSLRSIIKNNFIYIFYPKHANAEDPKIQSYIRKIIIEAWRLEAKAYLPKRVKELAEIYGFNYNKLNIRNNRSRWGSCSHTNNISLNVQLMRLPGELCDYVILHELCHTIHKNHSHLFWDTLDKVCNNAKIKDKKLNKYLLSYW
jgi:predicted metal-dependent hydrolase